MIRLHKFIANCGYTSRRRAELLILAGRVTVDGRCVRSLGATVNPDRACVRVNGETIELPPPTTIMLHKPPNLITSTHDTHDRLTVMDILPRSLRTLGVLPVGRLDQDTEGLLVLSNDGDLSHRITHPSFETEKEYEAEVPGRPTQAQLKALAAGVRLEDGPTSGARILAVTQLEAGTAVRLVIHEGRKRQVRRMFEAVGHEVHRLVRLRVGGLRLGDLPPGEWRALAREEINLLVPGWVPGQSTFDQGTDDQGSDSS